MASSPTSSRASSASSRPYLYESVRPGGWLVASGIIVEREEEVRTALEAAGFTDISRGQMGDWVALRAWRR